jgi:hypothetical protein
MGRTRENRASPCVDLLLLPKGSRPNMIAEPADDREPYVSGYLSLPMRTLQEVCRESKRDDGGGLCNICELGDLCRRIQLNSES